MPRIYVAGPLLQGHTLSHEEGLANWEKTCLIAEQLMQKGWAPYVPHHTIHMHKLLADHNKKEISFDRWMQIDSSFISVCSALFFIGHSKGADRELNYALDNGITVYVNVDEVPRVKPDCHLCPEFYNKDIPLYGEDNE